MNKRYYIPEREICIDMRESDGYIDYTVYDKDGHELDGGQIEMDRPVLTDENIREVIYFALDQNFTYVEVEAKYEAD